jgi:hypothetical protein
LTDGKILTKTVIITSQGSLMNSITLVHAQESRQVSGRQFIHKCTILNENPAMIAAPYLVRSSVSLSVFNDFVSALEDEAIQITKDNYGGLMLLVNEFGCQDLAEQLSIFRESSAFNMPDNLQDSSLQDKVMSMKELMLVHDRRMAALHSELFTQSQRINSILTEWLPRLSRVEMEMKQLSLEVTALQRSSEPSQRLTTEIRHLRDEVRALQTLSPAVASPENTSDLDSKILSDFPAIFTEFTSKQLRLLWRGTRDGFGGRDFHSRCDGHGNTLTVIEDTNGNIFGGYTPLAWESRERTGNGSNRYKSDESLESWLFTLKNPQNTAPMIFALNENDKRHAIFCGCSGGPEFGIGRDGYGDIAVRDQCNSSKSSSSSLGRTYINETNVDGDKFLTGSAHFIVKEIEVFEITA